MRSCAAARSGLFFFSVEPAGRMASVSGERLQVRIQTEPDRDTAERRRAGPAARKYRAGILSSASFCPSVEARAERQSFGIQGTAIPVRMGAKKTAGSSPDRQTGTGMVPRVKAAPPLLVRLTALVTPMFRTERLFSLSARRAKRPSRQRPRPKRESRMRRPVLFSPAQRAAGVSAGPL